MNNVISTKVSIFRNIKDYRFVPKLTAENRREIEDKVAKALSSEMSVLEVNTLEKSMLDSLKNKGIRLANNQKILINSKDNVVLTFFEGEHIKISSVTTGYDSSIFARAQAIAAKLGDRLSLSYNDEYGYLMSDITKIGMGIELECKFALPSLKSIEKIDQVKRNIKKMGYNLRDTNEKNVYILSGRCNLGFSSEEIFKEFEKIVIKLQDLEVESVKLQSVEDGDDIMDAYYRSVAVLKAAHLMSYDELKTHLNNLRTGLNLGLKDVSLAETLRLQELLRPNVEFVSKSDLINLAKSVKDILKGE